MHYTMQCTATAPYQTAETFAGEVGSRIGLEWRNVAYSNACPNSTKRVDVGLYNERYLENILSEVTDPKLLGHRATDAFHDLTVTVILLLDDRTTDGLSSVSKKSGGCICPDHTEQIKQRGLGVQGREGRLERLGRGGKAAAAAAIFATFGLVRFAWPRESLTFGMRTTVRALQQRQLQTPREERVVGGGGDGGGDGGGGGGREGKAKEDR
ncbi:hypothetical protein M0804_007676 [Polistes exclamans]|nr:hypothetical protein M0804_007676 [Polistes exclamans]